MMKKGDRCFHVDYGNGCILRVNKQNIAKVQFECEPEPVWVSVGHLDEPLDDEEARAYMASLKAHENRECIDSDERKAIRREAKKPFVVPGVAEKIAQMTENNADVKASNEGPMDSDVSDENDYAQKPLVPVRPISLHEMPMPAPDIKTFCGKFSQCVAAEIFESRSKYRVRKLLIHHAAKIQDNSEASVYTIEADSDVFYPEGSEITIWRKRSSLKYLTKGSIAACDGPTMFVEIKDDLNEDMSGMYYSIDEAAILEALNERLSEIAEKPASPILHELVTKPLSHVRNCAIERDHLGQEHALESALHNPITFIWGPPGTGKTETLARIVLAHIQAGHRILMVSQCNVSVDAAILRVQKLDERPTIGECVRYGYPRDPDLVDNASVTVSMMALMNNQEQYNARVQIMRDIKKTPHSDPRYLELRKKLETVSMAMIQTEKAIVKHAKFIATTVSKAIVDASLYKDEFDVVLFDEASMALIPQIVFSASLAKCHFVCAGDFSQLPPIIMANRSALEADIFHYAGISKAVHGNRSHAWLYLLDEQYRMHETIADFAGKFMYRGLLRSAPSTRDRAQIAQIRPVSGDAVVLLNLQNSHARSVDSSKINLLSAMMTFGVALNIIAQGRDPGIITPYSPQARLLRCMARDYALYSNSSERIACSTVHQFQGSERDVILYDIVETERPGIMLVKNDNQYADRLFNVAMTRARGKLCIVADKSFVCTRMPPNLMLSTLVRRYFNHCVNIRKQFAASMASLPSKIMQVFTHETLLDEVRMDIDSGHASIQCIVSPEICGHFEQARLFSSMIARHKEAGVKLTMRVPNPERYGAASTYFSVEQCPETLLIIDKTLLWYFYRQEDGVLAGIRWTGMHTVRRIRGVYFNA